MRFHQSAYPRRHWVVVCVYRPLQSGTLSAARMKNWAAKNLPFEQDCWQPLGGVVKPEGKCPICHKPVRREPWLSPKGAPCPHCGSRMDFESAPRLAPERRETEMRGSRSIPGSRSSELCRADVSQEKLFTELIQGLTKTMYAVAGVIWIVHGRGLRPQYGLGLGFTGLYENPTDRRRHARLLTQILASGQTRIVQPPVNPDGNDDNPTSWALLVVPLKDGDKTKALLEMFYWPSRVTTLHECYQWTVRKVFPLVCQSRAFRSLEEKPWWRFWK